MLCIRNMILFYIFLAALTSYFLQSSAIISVVGNAEFNVTIKDNLTINAGDCISLKCSTKVGSVNWENETENSSVKCEHYPSECTLNIRNAQYYDTGYYVCIVNSIEEKVYLYVKDNEHLFVNDTRIQITGMQYTSITIPCRMTAPNITVKFMKQGKETTQEDLKETKKMYDPRIGFTLENINNVLHGDYECYAIYENYTSNISVSLTIVDNTTLAPKPIINILEDEYIGVGNDIFISCKIEESSAYTNYEMNWIYPSTGYDEKGHIYESNTSVHNENGNREWQRTINLTDAKVEDTGNYTCFIKDHNNKTNSRTTTLNVCEKSCLFVMEPENNYTEKISKSDSILVKIIAKGYPTPTVLWKDSNGNKINHSAKFNIFNTDKQNYSFKINDLSITDAGNYTLEVHNDDGPNGTFIRNIKIIVKDQARIKSITDNNGQYYIQNKSYEIICNVTGYPQPKLVWSFRECNATRYCDNVPFTSVANSSYKTEYKYNKILLSTLKFTAMKTRQYKCQAGNSKRQSNMTTNVFVTDLNRGANIYNADGKDNYIYVAGDDVKIYCAAPISNYSDTFSWNKITGKNNSFENEIKNSTDYEIYNTNTLLSYKSNFVIKNVTIEHDGIYQCNFVSYESKRPENKTVKITVLDIETAKINNKNDKEKEKTVTVSEAVKMTCSASGRPQPKIQWFKDNEIIIPDHRIHLTNGNQTLYILSSTMKDDGTYTCIVENRGGQDKKEFSLKVTESLSDGVVAAIVVLVLALGVLAAVIIYRYRKEKELQKLLSKEGLDHFEEGATECLNPDLPIDEQADLLPYHIKVWEFPREKLRLGKQLGAGAFGVVMKAEAFGIVDDEEVTTVAVKMVKKAADFTFTSSLATELKIMAHLGKNLNVVNLLGACTKNIAKRELLVIVEFCRFGNLHNYLIRHRNHFIDQINIITGEIDPSIGANVLAKTRSASYKQKKKRSLSLTFSYSGRGNQSDSGNDSTVMSPHQYSNNSSSDGEHTCMSPTGTDVTLLSDSSVQPDWRSNMHGDYKPSHVQQVCTWDLLCWSFQVARGMEYLTSRKVLHGDLAARNILLADDNVVKICDFGLARTMYKSQNYKKKGEGPLPIKWMAIESIRDRVFSTESDVWSFGIVLWELFSLAHTPYPGMEVDEEFYNKLLSGYRMECPKYSTQEIYNLMLDCWQARPNLRPKFTEIAHLLGSMLGDSVRKHYIDLNDPYITMNMKHLEDHTDYLSMMSAPTFDIMMSPNYENNMHQYVNTSEVMTTMAEAECSGYLSMKSPTPIDDQYVFSPPAKPTTGTVFNYDKIFERMKRYTNIDIHNSAPSEEVSLSKNERFPGVESVNNLSQVAPTEVKNTNEFTSTKNPINKFRSLFNPRNVKEATSLSSLNNYTVKFTKSKDDLSKMQDTENSDYLSMSGPSTKNTAISEENNIVKAFDNHNYKSKINCNNDPYVNVKN